tara:strand:+ start:174 stop:455 length:282 start_codon:yes stop_codon:yes gene_type:complete
MNVLKDLEEFIKEFNQNNDEYFEIDSIRINFNKQHKKNKLEDLGNWKKINTNDKKIMDKLKKDLMKMKLQVPFNWKITIFTITTVIRINQNIV